MAEARKPGPPRLPHNKPRGSRGSSGRQFTPKTLARLMRNVDRTVLTKAIAIADIEDLFTPGFQGALFKRFDKLDEGLEATAERQSLLEALAFGTVILRIFRTVIFFIRLLPQARFLLLLLALFTIANRALESKTTPTAADLSRWAEEAGVTGLISRFKSQLALTLEPLITAIESVQNDLQSAGAGMLRDLRGLGRDFGAMKAQIEHGMNTRQIGTSIGRDLINQVEASVRRVRGLENLTANINNLVIRGLRDRVDQLKQLVLF